MKKKTLSVVVATHNEEDNIERCLKSIKRLSDEIVVVDGKSTDKTAQLARKYTDRVYITSNPTIFHINKQKGVDNATFDWVLQLDADEEVTSELADEIGDVIKNDNANDGLWIARKNYFVNKWMKKGGMYPDYVVRLFKKDKGYFPCVSVHEQIVINGTVGFLKHPIIHRPYPTFAEYKRKADTYTSLTADEYKKKKVPISFSSALKYRYLKPIHTFFTLFIRHRGFVDGWWGFRWAWNSGLHHKQAYDKYERNSQ